MSERKLCLSLDGSTDESCVTFGGDRKLSKSCQLFRLLNGDGDPWCLIQGQTKPLEERDREPGEIPIPLRPVWCKRLERIME